MSNALLEAALYYAAEKRWPVFPVQATKEPYPGTNGVLDATTDAAKIKAWWTRWPRAGIALDVGAAGMMALDLDPGHDLKELEASIGPLPKTQLIQRTPRGGRHLFFALAEGEIVSPSASKLAPNVDVRSFNSYTLLAPSRTADGEYSWDAEGKPAYRSDEMVRVANTAREKHRDRKNWIIEPDLPENIWAAEQWLSTDAKIAVEGQGGDHAAYATAAMMKSFGLSPETAFDVMWRVWNPRCRPPWSADEVDHLETKVLNGYEYSTSPPGNITAAYRVAKNRAVFQPVAVDLPSGREINAGRFRFVDRAGMDHIKAPEWLVHDFIPQGGSALLIGARGTFKSFVALDLGLSVATGVNFPWDGLWPQIHAAGPVLFAAGEGRPGLKQRQQAWERYHRGGKPAEGMILADPVPHITEDLEPFIEGALKLNPDGYRLCIIDTVGRAMQGVNENAQEHASKFTKLVETLQRRLGCAVLALHHTGHENGGRTRGSSVFEADTDTVVRLDRDGKEKLISLTMTKQKDAPEWDKPRYAQLASVQIGPKASSLVVLASKEAERPVKVAARAEAKRSEASVMLVLDKAVADILSVNPLRQWTTAALAQAVAMRDDVEITSKTLQNNQLVALREATGTKANRCYSPEVSRWRWKA